MTRQRILSRGLVRFLLAALLADLLLFLLAWPASSPRRYIVRTRAGRSVRYLSEAEAETLSRSPDTLVVPDVKVYPVASALPVPRPSEYQQEWYIESANNHQILEAWQYLAARDVTPGENVVVGVSDTGVFVDNEQLAGKVTGKIYIRDSLEFPEQVDQGWHGTWVSGIITANFDSKRPIGVAYGAQIYSAGFLELRGGLLSDGLLSLENIIERKRQGENIRVINMSWGCICDFPELRVLFQDVFEEALRENIVLVAAAGNSGRQDVEFLPAALMADIDGGLSVAALGLDFNRAYFSNFGQNAEVAAAGVAVIGLSTLRRAFSIADGTSAAAPIVSGLVAILASLRPELSPAEIESIIKATTVTHDDLASVDFLAAVKLATGAVEE